MGYPKKHRGRRKQGSKKRRAKRKAKEQITYQSRSSNKY